jgi:hypothetical protein
MVLSRNHNKARRSSNNDNDGGRLGAERRNGAGRGILLVGFPQVKGANKLQSIAVFASF